MGTNDNIDNKCNIVNMFEFFACFATDMPLICRLKQPFFKKKLDRFLSSNFKATAQ